MRIYNYLDPNVIFYGGDSYNRFRGKPFANDWGFQLNSMGFKDVEFTTKAEGTYRILGIGDSFSFGVVPYESNYLTLIESQLQQDGFKVEVLNMGIPGIGPDDYLALLVGEGLRLQPDMVLLSFFVGNDFAESRRDAGSRTLYSYSYIATLLHYLLTIRPKYDEFGGHGDGTHCDHCPSFDDKTYFEIERGRSYIYLLEDKTFANDLNDALFYLQEIKLICENNNSELVVVIIPDELQVNVELQTQLIRAYFSAISAELWRVSNPNDRLSASLATLGIRHIDLTDLFVRAAVNQPLYKPRDSHWNLAGNQLAADIITDELREIIPK